jgi:RNA polymerase sigma-70 factor (ECF subfamily)
MSVSLVNPTPVSLLERLRQPPAQAQEAWARFVRLYTPLLFAWAHRLGLQGADAADLVQDVAVLLVRKLPDFSYQRHPNFRAWLWKVLLNRCRENRRRWQPAVQGDEALLADLAEPDNVANWAEAEYRRQLLGRALQLLQPEFSESTWRAFEQYVLRERPAREVAGELGVSVNVVHLAKSRVLQRLREELDGLLD